MLTLALKNLSQKKFQSLLLGLTVVIGTAAVIVFLGLSAGISKATLSELEESNPLTEITVRPNIENRGIVSFLNPSQEGTLSEETITELSEISGIVEIYPEIQFQNFASVEARLLGLSLVTDSMIFGIDEGFIQKEISKASNWYRPNEPYPVVIPKKLLDIYNFTIAVPQGLPSLSEENLIGKEITLYPNYSAFFPQMMKKDDEIKLEVVGFSEKVNLVGVTLPYQVVEELNRKYGHENNENGASFVEIFVITDDANDTPQIAAEIEKLGLSTDYYQKNITGTEEKLRQLKIGLGVISGIILLVSAIAIISMFLAISAERKKEIGLLRAIGARKIHIVKIIMEEALIIGALGSIIGISAGLVSSIFLDRIGLDKLGDSTFAPESLFQFSPTLIIGTLLLGIFLSLISAFLPALKAANTNPIEALQK